ncbi:MAG TPA: TonB family protein [Flavipsychrobacter sp.]|jgi:periplasmic protein TonB
MASTNKKVCLLFILMQISIVAISSAQISSTGDTVIFSYVEHMPEFKGDMVAFISNQMRPEFRITGSDKVTTIFLKCMINEHGKVASVYVTNPSSHEPANAEAVRIVKSMPDWIPGRQNNKAVRVYVKIPIKLRTD